jgi:hypothetical protein
MAAGSKYGNSDTAVGSQSSLYSPSSTGYTGNSAQAAGTVGAAGVAADSKAFNTLFAPYLAQGYTQQQIVSFLQTLPPDQSAKVQEQLSNATNAIQMPDSTFDKVMQGLALASGIAGAGLLGGAVIAPAVAAAAGGGLAGGIAGGAASGAATGAFGSALEGQNIGKGALLGAAGGGLGAAAAPVASSLASSTGLSQPIASGLVKGGIGAATSAVGGGSAGLGFLGGAASGAASGLNTSLGGNALTGAAAGAGASLLTSAAAPLLSGSKGNTGNMATSVNSGLAGAQITAPSNPNGMQLLGSGTVAPTSTDTSLASTIGAAAPGLLQSAAGVYGAQNAAQAQQTADNSAINTQQNTLGNINNIWSTQQQTGQGANTALQSSLGLGGAPADPSNFLNMPGYQFAVQQGTQAIQRQAAAMGNAYTPNTAEAVGQYVTGTASQDYNTYISQLMGAAGLGTTANQGLQTGQQTTGSNISQLQQNIGQAQASGVTGAANSIGGLFGVNGAGTSLIGAANKSLGGSTAAPNYNGVDPETFGGGTTGGYVPSNGGATYTSGDYGFGVAPNDAIDYSGVDPSIFGGT